MSTFYWFGVDRLEIAPVPAAGANTAPTWVQVPSIEQASLKASASEVKAYGDDQLQYTFVHSPEAQLSVKLTKIRSEIIALLTGTPQATVSGNERIHIMSNYDLNPALQMIRVRMPARDDTTGAARSFYMVFFRTQVRPVWDNLGSERGKSTELNWTFDILSSTQDERGNALPSGVTYAMGRYDWPTS